MKNQSKDKNNINQNTQNQLNTNKLNKTQVQPKPVQNFQNTYYGQRKNIQVNQQKQTQLPPRINSTQKMQYKVSENMTNSNIQSAKMGLQLLKKKMSRNGMSRQKKTSIQKRQQNTQQQIPKKTFYKPQNQNQYSNNQYNNQQRQNFRNPPKLTQKRSMKQEVKSPPIPTKSTQMNKKNTTKYEEYINQNQEVPIKANQDFNAILQRQLAKERQMGNMPQQEIKKPAKMMQQPSYQNDQNVQLVPCGQGCGRKFNIDALQKHQKICRKVFQQKRKVFNAAQFRQPDVQDFKMPVPQPPQTQTTYKPQKNKKQPAKEQKIPKWKLQSADFRARMKLGRGQQLSKEQQQAVQITSGNKQCPCCGRKFNEQAAKRHIPICQQKSKQLPRMNMNMKKK